ncbi:MAG: Ig-like domain-containing protein [Planctomycetes bacterium]|nr:Ig-like domain-containing protein [Planctomycetota bacterium]
MTSTARISRDNAYLQRAFRVFSATLLGTSALWAAQEDIRVHYGESPGDRYGALVTGVGDVDLDTYQDYAISSLGGFGKVEVFDGRHGSLLYTLNGSEEGGEFGRSLCTLGDLNDDGRDEFAVTAWMEGQQASPDAGKVYIYSGDGSLLAGPGQFPELLIGSSAGDRFGSSIASFGDWNGDGSVEVAVGAIDDDENGSSSGSVRIIQIGWDSSTEVLTVALMATLYGEQPGDRFGSSLATGDLVGDPGLELAIGAPLSDGAPALANRGAVQVWAMSPAGVLSLVETLQGAESGDQFGHSVAILSGWSAVNERALAVASVQADLNGSSAGSVGVFSLSRSGGSLLNEMHGLEAGDKLGAAIANGGDVNQDGHEDLIIGVPGDDTLGFNAGKAQVYSGADNSLLAEVFPKAVLGSPPGHYFSGFGSSVAGLGRVDYDGPESDVDDYYSDLAVGTDCGSSNADGQALIFTEHLNEPPVLVDDLTPVGQVSTLEDTSVVLNILANDFDVDGRIELATLEIAQQPLNGAASVTADNQVLYTPVDDFFGTDNFTYSAKDDDGASGVPATVTVQVGSVNDAPVGVADFAITDEDTPVLIFVTANDTDVDGAPQFATLNITEWPTNGVLSVDFAAEGVLYSPNLHWHGTDSFSYQVQDEYGLWTEITSCQITVTDVNDLPVAVDDSAVGFQAFPLNVDVLANDYEVEPDGTIAASGITITAQPVGGTLSIDLGAGVVVYTGDSGFVGTDSFKYTVTDDDGGVSNEAVAVLTILEDCNFNQVWDTEDISTGFSADCNATGVPDECELDGNDCDTNLVPDECDPDCNANGRPDDCDFTELENIDCDSNGVLDDCQVDCNQNGLPDNCDINLAVSRDCDFNGLPDECDGIRWVDVLAADCNGDGSWGAPHCTLQQAIFASSPGDVIMALPGVYEETIDLAGRNISLKSAAGMGMTFIDGQGNGPVVRFQANESPACLMQGFTVTGGSASGGQAGGIAISSASPTIRDCRIQGNTSSDFGAGASTRNNAHPRFYDCVFVGNDAGRNGGGMIVDNGSIQLYRCEFIGNSADDSGGGLFARNGANGVIKACNFRGNWAHGEDGGGAFLDGVGLSFERCEFSLNSAGELGGGAAVRNATGTPSFDDCSFDGNVAGESGGALSFDAVNVVLRGSSMRGNESLGRGGALYVANASHVQIEGNELIGNSAGTLGGGMFLAAQGGWIRRCTSSANSAGLGGGGAYLVEYSTPALDSCIFWGDSPDEVRVEVTPGAISGNKVSAVTFPDAVRYSCVQGGWPVGQGNIASDPMFRDSLGGDFGLGVGSPCIDAGNPSISTDPDGSRADMGAEAYQGSAYIDVMTWNFSAGERIEPVVIAQSPAEVLVASSNYWQELRDNGYKERLHRLAELVVEEDPYIFHAETLIRARVRPVGSVLSGSSQGTYITAFDQAEIFKDAMEDLGWGSYLGKSQVFDVVVPVITCGGYADVRLQGYQVSYSRESQPLQSNLGFFNEQLTGPVGGIGGWAPTYGWRGFRVQDGSSPWIHFTNLDPSSSEGLQAVQVGELLTRLIVPSPENTEHAVLAGDFASTPGSPAYNMLIGAGFQDAWTPFGSGSGATCCQANDLFNSASQLSERRDWGLSNDPLWSAKGAWVVGQGEADRTRSGRWVSTHAGLLTRWGTL